jgi:FkbM family methyltransferase
MLKNLVRQIRPAPVGSLVAHMLGFSKRRILSTQYGRFLVNPMSNFGFALEHSSYEPAMTAALNRHLKRGHTFVDLGANEGYFSVIASGLLGPEGKVIAVEPQSRLQDVLRENFALNDCSNIQCLRAVISDRVDTKTLHLTSELNNGGSSLFRSTRYPLQKEQVQSLTLDGLIKTSGIERCDLMKVDIEGGEYEVFMCSEPVLRAGVIRRIALDIHYSLLERQGRSGKKLHEVILDCGYSVNDETGVAIYTFKERDNCT